MVVGNVVVVTGNTAGAGDTGTFKKEAAPEDVRGFDAQSGKLLWTFHVVPRPGEFGGDTWGNDSWKIAGDLGAWNPMTADEDLGYVYHSADRADRVGVGRVAAGRQPVRRLARRARRQDRQARLAFPDRASQPLGMGERRAGDARRHHRRRPAHQGGDAAEQERLPVRRSIAPTASRCGRSKSARCRSRTVAWRDARRRRSRSRRKPPAFDRQGVTDAGSDRLHAGAEGARAGHRQGIRHRSDVHAAVDHHRGTRHQPRHADAAGLVGRGELEHRRVRSRDRASTARCSASLPGPSNRAIKEDDEPGSDDGVRERRARFPTSTGCRSSRGRTAASPRSISTPARRCGWSPTATARAITRC